MILERKERELQSGPAHMLCIRKLSFLFIFHAFYAHTILAGQAHTRNFQTTFRRCSHLRCLPDNMVKGSIHFELQSGRWAFFLLCAYNSAFYGWAVHLFTGMVFQPMLKSD